MIPYVYYFASFIQNKKIEVEECFWVVLQKVPSLRAFWDLEKNVLLEICVSGPDAKIPHLHVYKPKSKIRGSGSDFCVSGGPPFEKSDHKG